MIILMIMLAYAGISLHTFRYTGAVMLPDLNDITHSCPMEMSCRCKNCGGDLYNHRRKVLTYCNHFERKRHHPFSFALPILVAILWPTWYIYRGYRRATVDMVGPTFFKEPKAILSKEDRLKAQEKYIAELEKELEIK